MGLVWVTMAGLPSSAWATCDGRLSSLGASLDQGVAAFQDMDATAFGQARAQANESLGCLEAAITPDLALRFHLVDALDAFVARSHDRAVVAFVAVLSIDAHYQLPTALAPPETLLRAWYQEARGAVAGPVGPVMATTRARLLVDGRPARGRPVDRPAILQWVGVEDGRPVWSGYLAAGTPIPGSVLPILSEYETAVAVPVAEPVPPARPETPPAVVAAPVVAPAPTPPPLVPPVETTPRRVGPLSAVLLTGTGGGLVASGVLLGMAWSSRTAWEDGAEGCVLRGECDADPEGHLHDLAALEERARNLGYYGQAAAGLTLALGTAAVLSVRW